MKVCPMCYNGEVPKGEVHCERCLIMWGKIYREQAERDYYNKQSKRENRKQIETTALLLGLL